jgi:chemotaxis protein histidine kinase CheA
MAKDGKINDEGTGLEDLLNTPAKENDFDLDSFLKENDFLPKNDDTSTRGAGKTSPKKNRKASAKKADKLLKKQEVPLDALQDKEKDKDVTPAQNALPEKQKDETKSANRSKKTPQKADPNATMTYAAAGADYPELPLVSEITPKEEPPVAQKTSTRKSMRTQPAGERDTARANSTAKTSSSSTRSTQTKSSQARASSSDASPTARKSRTGKSSTVKKQAAPPAASKTGKAVKRTASLTSLADPKNFQTAALDDNSYKIRGGGKRHNKATPVLTILIAVVIIAGIGVLGFALSRALTELLVEKPADNVITLSAADTRAAVDSEMPKLVDVIWQSPDEAMATFVEAGWNVFSNARNSDNPDGTSQGSEIIHLNAQGTEDSLKGYYESEFNAYDFDELQTNFNGGWMLDLSSGERGRYAQVKYVNFSAESLEDEMEHLRSLQGLSEGSSIIDAQGLDEFENTYIQGYTVFGDTTYFWKLIGIGFNDYYRGQDKRNVPDTCVYMKCTIATFDFYGISELTASELAAASGTAEEVEAPAEEAVTEEEY